MNSRRKPALADVIDALMRKRGIKNPSELARLAGLQQPTVHRILNGASRDPESKTIEKLASFFRVSASQLRGDTPLNGAAEPLGHYNVEPGPSIRAVNLISWVQAGKSQPVEDPYETGAGEKTIYISKKVGARTYALRIRGDSMENPSGKPTFPEGCVIVVDPDKPAGNGSFVVVRLDESAEATFKQLVEDAGRRYLKPLNPRYPIERIDGNATLCGTWVQTIIDSD